MATNTFLNKDNIKMLWDVISDEDIFKYLKLDSQERISQMFVNNLRGFYETERKKTNNVVDINKKYILLILNHIKKTYSPVVPNKIKISYEEPPIKELVTYEEIQNDRKSQFDRDLNRAQEEFTNAVTLKVPDVPNFSDNYKESPITEMDKILKEMTAKRNYEVEQINKRQQSSESDTSNWLKSQETSLKSEKFTPPQNNNSSRLKYLNSEGQLLPTKEKGTALEQNKKSVSWGDTESRDNIEMIIDDEPDENIFSKFKKIDTKSETINNSNSNSNNELNEVKAEIKQLHAKLDKIIELLNGKQ
jgi:hypothetical protein